MVALGCSRQPVQNHQKQTTGLSFQGLRLQSAETELLTLEVDENFKMSQWVPTPQLMNLEVL